MRVIVFLGILLAACAPSRVSAPDQATAVTLTDLIVGENLIAGRPYPVALHYDIGSSGEVVFTVGCFTWNGEGPYCFDVTDNRTANQVVASLRTGNPRVYELAGYVIYTIDGSEEQSNTVEAVINVRAP